MPRRLWLHIGSHKTGSTSLQSYFHANADLMQTRGMTYHASRKATVHDVVQARDHENLLPLGFRAADPEGFARKLAASAGPDVLASSENFSLFFHAEPIAELQAALAPHFDEVRILSYVRRQDRHAVSHHQEGAKPSRTMAAALFGHSLSALPDPTPDQALYLDYDRRLGLWAAAFGDAAMRIRCFDRAYLRNGDVVADAVHQIGLDDQGFERVEEQNTSLSALQSRVGHMMNEAMMTEGYALAVLDALKGGARGQPARQAAEAFLAPYRDGNARLNARFGITPLPGLFPDDFDDYPEVDTPAWDFAASEEALKAMIGVLARQVHPLRRLRPEDLRRGAVALQRREPEIAVRMIQTASTMRPKDNSLKRAAAEMAAALTGEVPASAPRRAAGMGGKAGGKAAGKGAAKGAGAKAGLRRAGAMKVGPRGRRLAPTDGE